MQSISKRLFTHEYRAEAVRLVTAQGMGITDAAKKLALSVKTYSRWVRVARAGTLMSVDTHRVQPVTDLQAEVSRLEAGAGQSLARSVTYLKTAPTAPRAPYG